MSIESIEDFEAEPQRSNLARILARQVLTNETTFWRPDYLSCQMADDVAWEIGTQAHVVPVRRKTLYSSEGETYALQIDRYDNVIPLHRD